MGEDRRDVDKSLKRHVRKFWGLRPWKRHSTILMIAGIIYGLIGVQYIFGPDNKIRDNGLIVLLQFASIHFWGCIFLASGIATMISSRWPPFSETWGYMLLTGLSSAWMATYLIGGLFYHTPNGLGGALLWGLLAFMWWAISGLLNPDRTAVISRGNI